MSWKYVILIPCILGVALMETLTVTPEEVQEQLATMKDYLNSIPIKNTIFLPFWSLYILGLGESAKSNFSEQIRNYSIFDMDISSASLGEESYQCVKSAMNELTEYSQELFNSVDNVVEEMNVLFEGMVTFLSAAAIELDALSESVNSCNNSTCAEELSEELNLWHENILSYEDELDSKGADLEDKLISLGNPDYDKLEQLKEKVADCLNL